MEAYPNSSYSALPVRYQHPRLLSWLKDDHSTTYRLRSQVPNLKFQLLKAHSVKPQTREAPLLNLTTDAPCWGRQILFSSNNKGFLFSSVLIPPQTLIKNHDELVKLGTRPLGEVVFREASDIRRHCGISLLKRSDPLLQTIERYIIPSLDHALARHSICYHQSQPLLIHDVFLPDFIDFLLCKKK